MSNYIGHCNQCNYALFAEEDQITSGEDWRKLYPGEARRVANFGVYAHCATYGHKAFRLYAVKGNYNPDHPCDDRCMNAKGTECSCSCGGANHGRGHASEFVQAKLPSDSEATDEHRTDKQADFIAKLIDEREMAEDARERALAMLPTITKSLASKWIEKLLTLPKK